MTEQEQINALKDENLCLKDENSILEFQLKNRLNENVSLIEQIDALKAQVNCLREALLNTIMYRVGTVNYGDPLEALELTSEQCLAKVKAKAIEDYKQEQAEMKRMELATKIMVSSI